MGEIVVKVVPSIQAAGRSEGRTKTSQCNIVKSAGRMKGKMSHVTDVQIEERHFANEDE